MYYKKNMDEVQKRYMEYWNHENHDRPIISIIGTDPYKIPYPKHANLEEQWMDTEYMLKKTNTILQHTYYGCEAFPLAFPDLGPDQFAGFYGTPIEFGETTSWAHPDLQEVESFQNKVLDKQGVYYKKIKEMLQAMVEDAKDRYIVGIPDLHPGADGLVSMRGPQELCIDTFEEPEFIKMGVMKLFEGFKDVYNEMYDITTKYQNGTSNWMGIWHPKKFYVTSCDFCCMISPEMFEEFILEELQEELKFLDASVFHLDGPGALKHLERLLQLERLKGIQWVYGAGARPAPEWLDVVEKIQSAGKLVQMDVEAKDLQFMLEHTKPEGVMYKVHTDSIQDAKELEKIVTEFKR